MELMAPVVAKTAIRSWTCVEERSWFGSPTLLQLNVETMTAQMLRQGVHMETMQWSAHQIEYHCVSIVRVEGLAY